jgi:hypothetical protein
LQIKKAPHGAAKNVRNKCARKLGSCYSEQKPLSRITNIETKRIETYLNKVLLLYRAMRELSNGKLHQWRSCLLRGLLLDAGAYCRAPEGTVFGITAKLGSFAKLSACAAGGHFLAAARK